MTVLILITAALSAYLIAGLNPAIEISKRVYHKDIRTLGSGNPGFTNFKRCFGGGLSILVLILDLSKAALVTALFAPLFERYISGYALGAAYTCFFAMLGHAFPIMYSFKGGKGFLVYMSIIWFADLRAGAVALVIMLLLLLITKYMSLATVTAMLSCPVTLAIVGAEPPVIILFALCSLFMTIRHKENIVRLLHGTEKKFKLTN